MKKLLITLLAVYLSCFAGKLNIVTTTGTTQIDFNQMVSMQIVTTTPAGMVAVAGGTFQMGDGSISYATPVHSVTLSSFYIGKYEVTQAEWLATMGINPSFFIGDLNRPVEYISWYDVMVYCNKRSIAEGLTPCYTINGSTNPTTWGSVPSNDNNAVWNAAICNLAAKGYRMPTEAEWEFAARGGNSSNGYIYAGSNTIDDVAWYQLNSGLTTHAVGTKAPNELGLYDMSGNVFEWTWDRTGIYSASAQTNPTGAETGINRTARGGCYEGGVYSILYSRIGYRDNSGYPSIFTASKGFRLARTY